MWLGPLLAASRYSWPSSVNRALAMRFANRPMTAPKPGCPWRYCSRLSNPRTTLVAAGPIGDVEFGHDRAVIGDLDGHAVAVGEGIKFDRRPFAGDSPFLFRDARHGVLWFWAWAMGGEQGGQGQAGQAAGQKTERSVRVSKVVITNRPKLTVLPANAQCQNIDPPPRGNSDRWLNSEEERGRLGVHRNRRSPDMTKTN
jgi:hypothetical protein